MTNAATLQDRLAATGLSGPVELRLLPEPARMALRADPAHGNALSGALRLDLPTKIGGRANNDGLEVLCLGPDEWVVHTDAEGMAAVQAAFAKIYGEVPHSLVDISDRDIAIELRGVEAETLLSTGCPIDLSRIRPGHGKRTLFDSVQVVLLRDGEDLFRMEVWRSFLPHVWGLLNTANRELEAGL
ncbi:sarcosine oxidase subunit gamma [Amaricoccus tamworthensis]|uniref:sarcosine oxidase subunit gamma n=1 Tax=Amaricoccus tamworthensis TaxID=57002 RepID=UPI003C7B658C